jgi:hypothetical protein
VYFAQFTGEPVHVLAQALPHPGVVLTLVIGNIICRVSERAVFATPAEGMEQLLRKVLAHAVSGAFAVLAFCGAVYIFECKFQQYIGTLRCGTSRQSQTQTETFAGRSAPKISGRPHVD